MANRRIEIYRAYLDEQDQNLDIDTELEDDDFELDYMDDDDYEDELDSYFISKDFGADDEGSKELDTLGMRARMLQAAFRGVKELNFPRGFRSELSEFERAAGRIEDAVERFPQSNISWKTQDDFFGNRRGTNYSLVMGMLSERRQALSASRRDTDSRKKIDAAIQSMKDLNRAYRAARDLYRN